MAEKSYLIKKSFETPTNKFTANTGKLKASIVSIKGANGKELPKGAYSTRKEGTLFVVEFAKPMIFFIELKLS